MGEETQQHRQQAPTSSRLGMRAAAAATRGGEIVEVQGGHIVRSTGRKDRHSKVCTAKGPRDRRVRLSAHTAIQFYDVQDRLGYDRPSKAVDWLIKKAKTAIDELAQLPAWKPTATTTAAPNSTNVAAQQQSRQEEEEHQLNQIAHRQPAVSDELITSSGGSRRATTLVGGGGGGGGGGARMLEFHPQQQQLGEDNANNKYNSGGGSDFLSPTMDNDIADTIKSFFPMVAAAETSPVATSSFQNYHPPPDLLSRTTSGASNHNHNHYQQQDLRLSLQSFQDPILLHQQQQQQHHHHQQQQHVQEQVLFSGITPLGFDGGSSGWSEQQHQQQDEQEHGRLQRMVPWNNAADAGSSGHGGGFIFNTPAVAVQSPVVFGHGQFFTQRGPLQSSNTPSIRAWIDPSSMVASTAVDHFHHHHHYLSQAAAIHQASIGYAGSSSGVFSGFRVPARIQGEEEHDGISDKPSSASSDSRH